MGQDVKHNSLNDSKLVKLLSQYEMSNVEVSHKDFAQRLSLLVDLSDSVMLSESLRAIPKMSAGTEGNTDVQNDTLIQEFLNQRSTVLKSILKSFDLNEVFVQIKLPTPKPDTTVEETLNFDQYQRFYLLHQSELDFKIEKLRAFVRHNISKRSLKLAQLSELDKTLSKSMTIHTRKRFSVVPKVLKIRFEQLYTEHCNCRKDKNVTDIPYEWLSQNAWLYKFYSEMQQILLAEFEVRLQPIIGLVEAYNEDLENKV